MLNPKTPILVFGMPIATTPINDQCSTSYRSQSIVLQCKSVFGFNVMGNICRFWIKVMHLWQTGELFQTVWNLWHGDILPLCFWSGFCENPIFCTLVKMKWITFLSTLFSWGESTSNTVYATLQSLGMGLCKY